MGILVVDFRVLLIRGLNCLKMCDTSGHIVILSLSAVIHLFALDDSSGQQLDFERAGGHYSKGTPVVHTGIILIL